MSRQPQNVLFLAGASCAYHACPPPFADRNLVALSHPLLACAADCQAFLQCSLARCVENIRHNERIYGIVAMLSVS